MPEEERACPQCGKQRECIGHDTTEIAELEPAKIIVRVDMREKLQCKRWRADKAASRASAHDKSARAITDRIPLGQPILVGHHSEGRHRRDLARAHSNTGKAIAEENKAKALRRRADKVGSGGISSDDPKAVAKLEAQAKSERASIERMVALNAAHRSGSWAAVKKAATASEWKSIERAQSLMPTSKPFTFALSNARGNLRRIEARIAELHEREQGDRAPAGRWPASSVRAASGVEHRPWLQAARQRVITLAGRTPWSRSSCGDHA